MVMAAGLYALGKRQLKALKEISKGIVSIFDVKELEQKNASRILTTLENRGLIIRLGGEMVELSEKGLALVKILASEDIVLEKPTAWDGWWHLVCYDIPEIKKAEREYFQRKLKELEFKKIQNSLWVYPYDCKEEIAVFAESLGINYFVVYLNTNKLPQESMLREFYGLSGQND
jgi:DNA-binding transcriptional regulator PaaX